jgi:hypothetical protein
MAYGSRMSRGQPAKAKPVVKVTVKGKHPANVKAAAAKAASVAVGMLHKAHISGSR